MTEGVGVCVWLGVNVGVGVSVGVGVAEIQGACESAKASPLPLSSMV